jgi:hypothetical protein
VPTAARRMEFARHVAALGRVGSADVTHLTRNGTELAANFEFSIAKSAIAKYSAKVKGTCWSEH